MGTNFYLFTKDNEAACHFFPYEYELTDVPEFGYRIHIAKTSAGWLPLFQKHDAFDSVAGLLEIYDSGLFRIVDEYGGFYDWEAFRERVLNFNGGVDSAVPKTPVPEEAKSNSFYDKNITETPISHLRYARGAYAGSFTRDPDGYEFMDGSFL